MSTIDVGALLYTVHLKMTAVTEFGVSFADLVAGGMALPAEGARFDAAFEGRASGPKLYGTVSGVDYIRVRADGRFELHIHEVITTPDGVNIAAHGDGVGILRAEGGVADLRVNLSFFTSSDAYKWLNPLHVWGIGAANLVEGSIEVVAYAAFTSPLEPEKLVTTADWNTP